MNRENKMRTIVIAILFAAGLFRMAAAESIDIGPAIGTPIPSPFVVRDGTGAKTEFADLSGTAGVVLVFVRSAVWCPYCIQQLRDIQTVTDLLRKRGFRLASVSYDAPEVLAKFAEKYAITYDVMSDQNSAMIDAFGIRDLQYKPGSRAYGVPKPGIFIVDRSGIVRAKLAEDGYKTRPPSQAIVAAVEGLNTP